MASLGWSWDLHTRRGGGHERNLYKALSSPSRVFQPFVSVVIPALDEEATLRSAIESVRSATEVIVVDGGSRDGTLSEAEAAGARVLRSAACRGLQLDV